MVGRTQARRASTTVAKVAAASATACHLSAPVSRPRIGSIWMPISTKASTFSTKTAVSHTEYELIRIRAGSSHAEVCDNVMA